MECSDLTIEDFKDKLTMEGSPLDVLAVVAAAAEAQTPPNPRRRTKRRESDSSPPPSLPEEFANKIEEIVRGKALTTPATLVIEKTLFSSDVNKAQNRLSIPASQVVAADFLTGDEKSLLESYIDPETKTKKKYMTVKMIEPLLKVNTVKFSWWEMKKEQRRQHDVELRHQRQLVSHCLKE